MGGLVTLLHPQRKYDLQITISPWRGAKPLLAKVGNRHVTLLFYMWIGCGGARLILRQLEATRSFPERRFGDATRRLRTVKGRINSDISIEKEHDSTSGGKDRVVH
jgi:hypothetical protein